MFATTMLVVCAAFQVRATEAIDEGLLKSFEARTNREGTGKALLYRLFKPPNYDAAQKYPLVLILHGAAGAGADNQKQFAGGNHVPPAFFAAATNQARHPCFVLMPQCPRSDHWGGGSLLHPSEPSETTRLTLAVVEALQREFSLDPRRLYLVGVSMGGGGVWDLIARYPKMFAAAIPICAVGDTDKAKLVTKIPIWCFHGDHDQLVDVDYARTMIAAIRKAGGNPRYTEYPGVGHDSYVKAFAEPELAPWLFSQILPAPPAPAEHRTAK
jgi:predicted peptidase